MVPVTWREYTVKLSYPSGIERTGYVRAISARDANWRAARRYGLPGVTLGAAQVVR